MKKLLDPRCTHPLVLRRSHEILHSSLLTLLTEMFLFRRIAFVEPVKVECQHFIDCITQGPQPITNGREALNVVRGFEAAQKSLNRGGIPVAVKA